MLSESEDLSSGTCSCSQLSPSSAAGCQDTGVGVGPPARSRVSGGETGGTCIFGGLRERRLPSPAPVEDMGAVARLSSMRCSDAPGYLPKAYNSRPVHLLL